MSVTRCGTCGSVWGNPEHLQKQKNANKPGFSRAEQCTNQVYPEPPVISPAVFQHVSVLQSLANRLSGAKPNVPKILSDLDRSVQNFAELCRSPLAKLDPHNNPRYCDRCKKPDDDESGAFVDTVDGIGEMFLCGPCLNRELNDLRAQPPAPRDAQGDAYAMLDALQRQWLSTADEVESPRLSEHWRLAARLAARQLEPTLAALRARAAAPEGLREIERDQWRYVLEKVISAAKGWNDERNIYRAAWLREIGGTIRHKTHEIDGFVLRTRDIYELSQQVPKLKARITELEAALAASVEPGREVIEQVEVCTECGQVKEHQNHWAPFGWHDFAPAVPTEQGGKS